jgi:hypothetical protein
MGVNETGRRTAGALAGILLTACGTVPREIKPWSKPQLNVQLAFDTGPRWWTDPDEECPAWSKALRIAQQMAGCSESWVGDPAQKCQAAIRRCSPGCDVCRNLKPGQGPDTDFGSVLQPPGLEAFARTLGPGLCGGYDTRFDQKHACSDAQRLAKVMIHEATHACRIAGGSVDLFDHGFPFQDSLEGCHSEEVAPVTEGKECGDFR